MNLSECFLFLSAEVPATMGASKIIADEFPGGNFFSASSLSSFVNMVIQKCDVLTVCLIDFEIEFYEEITSLTAEYILTYPGISFIYFLRPNTTNKIVVKLKHIGVMGLMLKTAIPREIVYCINEVLQGRSFIQKEIANQIKDVKKLTPQEERHLFNPFLSLSKKELQVIIRKMKGMSGHEISHELNIGRSTVGTHFIRAKRKLQISTLIELLDLAKRFPYNKEV